MTKIEVFEQIKDITSKLIFVGLSEAQNFPSEKDGFIYISGNFDSSIALKDISYEKIYNILNEDKNYNIKMIDGALIQMMYTFENNDLRKHRLCFFPSPDLIEFQNNQKLYEEDVLYADVISKNIVTTPIRFDFDPDNHEIVHHPKSHLTIGQYKNCRLPITVPISPFTFVNFILSCFYNTANRKYNEDLLFKCTIAVERCIEPIEMQMLHLNIL